MLNGLSCVIAVVGALVLFSAGSNLFGCECVVVLAPGNWKWFYDYYDPSSIDHQITFGHNVSLLLLCIFYYLQRLNRLMVQRSTKKLCCSQLSKLMLDIYENIDIQIKLLCMRSALLRLIPKGISSGECTILVHLISNKQKFKSIRVTHADPCLFFLSDTTDSCLCYQRKEIWYYVLLCRFFYFN